MRRAIDISLAIFIFFEGFLILFLIETLLPTVGYEMGHLMLWIADLMITVSSFIVAVVHQWTKDEKQRRMALIWVIIISAFLHCLVWSPIIGEPQMY